MGLCRGGYVVTAVVAAMAVMDQGCDVDSGAGPGALAGALVPGEADAATGTEAGACQGQAHHAAWDRLPDRSFPRGPYVQDVSEHAATVVWRSAEPFPRTGCVTYEARHGQAEACGHPDSSGQFEVALGDLAGGTDVAYRVMAGPVSTGELRFRTAPGDDSPVRMLVISDAHANTDVLRQIAKAALGDGVDLAVSVGDQVSDPVEGQMDAFLDGLRALMHRVPLWPVIGNHEAYGAVYFHAFVVPGAAPEPLPGRYYSLRFGDVWFAALDLLDFTFADAMGMDTPELTWLKDELASPAAASARWRILFVHEPPYGEGWGDCEGYHGEPALRHLLVPLAAGVTAIFSGHVHGYEHGIVDGVHLFIVGGAGGGLDHACPLPRFFPTPWLARYVHHRVTVDAGCDAMTVEARDLEGTLIDRVYIPAK